MPARLQNNFRADLGFAQEKVQTSIVELRSNTTKTHWQMWLDFCAKHSLDYWFPEGHDDVPYLQVFAVRYLDGHIAPSQRPAQSDAVDDAMRNVGQAYSRMGTSDPRLNPQGKLDLRLQQLFHACRKQEPPAQRVKPMPPLVVTKLLTHCDKEPDANEGNLCIADMICLGFFFMMRPGEHTKSDDNTPIKLQDVKLHHNVTPLPITTTPTHELDSRTHVLLAFTTQKNSVKGKVITHGMTGHNLVCPVRTVARQVTCLQLCNAPLGAPLCQYFDNSQTPLKAHHVTAKNVTTMLRAEIQLVLADEFNWTLPQKKLAPGR